MKILFISMPSVHVIRWIENLEETPFELFWYDILNRGKLETIEKVIQFTDIQKRKLPYIKGEYFLYKKVPNLYQFIRPILEVTENEALEKIIKEIKPDVVHSFEMQSCSYPISKAMRKFPKIKWLYSCWGNDLFYFQNFKSQKLKINKVLKRVDYLHTDCKRDFTLAKKLGFQGKHLGVIPSGTGYKLTELEKYKIPIEERTIILIKGYHHIFGRALNVIKALEKIKDEIENYEVVVFGTHSIVNDYIEDKDLNYIVHERNGLSHQKLMKLMGKSLIYVGNNVSDGMPNTLLEAIVMGAFPIQSNPGNATAEIIQNGINGLLINDPENINHISQLIKQTIENKKIIVEAYRINNEIANTKLDYNFNQEKVIALYDNIAQDISVLNRF